MLTLPVLTGTVKVNYYIELETVSLTDVQATNLL